MARQRDDMSLVPAEVTEGGENTRADGEDPRGDKEKGRGKPNENVQYDRLIARMNASAQRKRMIEDAPGLRTPNSIAAAAGLAPSQVGDIYKHINQPSTQTINALAAWAEENPIPWLVDAGHVPAWVLDQSDTHRFPADKLVLWQVIDRMTPGQRAALRVLMLGLEDPQDMPQLPAASDGTSD